MGRKVWRCGGGSIGMEEEEDEEQEEEDVVAVAVVVDEEMAVEEDGLAHLASLAPHLAPRLLRCCRVGSHGWVIMV
jgi:hypothetical protein